MRQSVTLDADDLGLVEQIQQSMREQGLPPASRTRILQTAITRGLADMADRARRRTEDLRGAK